MVSPEKKGMEPVAIYSNSHIYYFKNEDCPDHPQLKNIINFLKWKTLKQIVKFDHVPADGNLINDLSLHDNLTLESKEFCRYRKIPKNIRNLLHKNIGDSITPILSLIDDWDKFPSEATPRERKIVTLLKAINLCNSFIVLDCPEKHLNSEIIENLKVVFTDLMAQNNCEIIISNSAVDGVWSDLCTKQIKYKKNSLFHIENFQSNYQNESEENQTNIKIAA